MEEQHYDWARRVSAASGKRGGLVPDVGVRVLPQCHGKKDPVKSNSEIYQGKCLTALGAHDTWL